MFKEMFILFCLSFLISVNGYAQRMLGQDFLALQQKNFKVKAAVDTNKRGGVYGNLDHTFGDDLVKVEVVLSKLSPDAFRVHFYNGPCLRNRNCGKYEYTYGYSISSFDAAVKRKDAKVINPLKQRVKLYCDLSKKYTSTKFLFSPILEHNLSPEAWNVLADVTLNVCPGVTLVNNPVKGVQARKYKNCLIERHGSGSDIIGADVVSTDGEGISDISIDEFLKKTNKSKYVMAWDRMYNCRTNSVNFVDPRARTECPEPAHFQLLAHIFDDRGSAPKFRGNNCKQIKAFVSPWVNKPFAENKGTGDVRADFPVIIVKDKASVMDVLNFKGVSVGKLGYYGTYDPLKGHRYYSKHTGGSGLSGYQFEIKAKQSTAAPETGGNPYTWLKTGNVCWGPVILGRRAGSYR